MNVNIQPKRVHPFKWAEEYGKNPIEVFEVKPLAVNPLIIAEVMAKNPGRQRPFSIAESVAKGGN